MQKSKLNLAVILAATLLSACGGNGDSGPAATFTPAAPNRQQQPSPATNTPQPTATPSSSNDSKPADSNKKPSTPANDSDSRPTQGGPSSIYIPSGSALPTAQPSSRPTATVQPTTRPSVTAQPSATVQPTATTSPTAQPSGQPSATPSSQPSATAQPSVQPSTTPSTQPSATVQPTATTGPTVQPSPTAQPSGQPSATPSTQPSATAQPSTQPTAQPSVQPSATPSITVQPTVQPTSNPGTGGIQNDGKKWVGSIFRMPAEGTSITSQSGTPNLEHFSLTEKTIINLESGQHVLTLPASSPVSQQNGILTYNNTAGASLPYRELKVSGDKYKNVQIGSIIDNSNGHSLFYRMTKEPIGLPSTGNATYKGDAFLNLRNMDDNSGQRTEQGKIEMNTNFSDKTLTFTVDSPSHKASIPGIIRQGSIDFREKNREALGPNTLTGLIGGFVGPNGEEIIGSYIHGNFDSREHIDGVFAGKKE